MTNQPVTLEEFNIAGRLDWLAKNPAQIEANEIAEIASKVRSLGQQKVDQLNSNHIGTHGERIAALDADIDDANKGEAQ